MCIRDRLPIEAFWGIGKVTARKMHSLGIHTGADLKECTLTFLTRNFGKAGTLYHDFANGIDPRMVTPERIRKSVGCESTFENDLTNYIAVKMCIRDRPKPVLFHRIAVPEYHTEFR